MNYTELIVFVCYFVFMLGIGLFFFFRSKDSGEKDFFLGGRKMGAWVSALSAGASDMSAWVLMGLPASIYAAGMGQTWIAIGLALTFQAVSEINDGQPLEIIFPEDGSPYSLTGTAMIDGREKNKDVVEVYEFIVNEFLVYDKENFSPEAIYDGQVNNIQNYPEDIVYADMAGIQETKEKERLLNLWKY